MGEFLWRVYLVLVLGAGVGAFVLGVQGRVPMGTARSVLVALVLLLGFSLYLDRLRKSDDE